MTDPGSTDPGTRNGRSNLEARGHRSRSHADLPHTVVQQAASLEPTVLSVHGSVPAPAPPTPAND